MSAPMAPTAQRDAPIAVLGAGSWGSALAVQFARGGRAVRLWGRDAGQLQRMAQVRVNERYLPATPFPQSLEVQADLTAALRGARDVLIVVPSHALRTLLTQLAPNLAPGMHVAWAT